MTQTLAVLITVHNRKDKTLKCLQLLYDQLPIEGYQVDVYLTDDRCTDGTPEAIRSQFPKVDIIQGDGNLFWNRGMYTAWQEAAKKDYDFYLWLNDDVELELNALAHILKCSDKKKHIALISGLLSTTDRTTIIGGRIKGKRVPVNGQMQKIEIMPGNCALIPRSVFQEIGFNDYYYNHAYGDYDYSLMAGKLGIEIYTTEKCVGYCDINVKVAKCFQPNVPLKQRWKILHTPLAYAKPNEIFYYEKKHHNIFLAFYRFILVYIRCLFPQIWKLLKK